MSVRRSVLDEHLAHHHGVVNVAELRALGYTDGGIDALVRRHVLLPVLPGVYRSAAWPPGLHQMLLAICKRNERAIISHTTAGQEWRIRRMAGPRIHVLVPHGSSPTLGLGNVTVHRCRRIDEDDVVQRADGVRLTSPARTLFDASVVIGVDRTESALEHLLNEGMCSFGQITATVERLARGGRPGSRHMAAVLRRRPAWSAAVQSDLELRMVRALRAHGLPEPVRQHPVRLPSGTVIHVDLAYPQWWVAG